MIRIFTPVTLSLFLVGALLPPTAASGAVLDRERRISASDATTFGFGSGATISGDTALVGGGSQLRSGGHISVLRRNSGGPDAWGEVHRITLPGRWTIQAFAISGDTVIVGAEFDFPGGDVEAAFLFQRDAGGLDNWGEIAQIRYADGEDLDSFGDAVAIDGDTAIVGAWSEDSQGTSAGAAYIFERNLGGLNNWGEVASLTASDGAAGDTFGHAVSISGNSAVVGANGAAAAYIFERNEGGLDNWGERVKLVASDAPISRFGVDVAIHDDTAVVGAFWDDEGGTKSGSAYVFERDSGGPGIWAQTAKLTASDAEAFDQFGVSVAVRGSRAVVGANLEADRAVAAGAAYVYEREAGPGGWGEVKKLTASDAGEQHRLGRAVAMSGNALIVGVPENDDVSIGSGAVYIYEDGTTCESGPTACTEWSSGSIVINELSPGKEKLRISLAKGPALSQADFGMPVQAGGTQYTTCLYDDASELIGQLQVSRAAGACAGKTCWKATGGDPPSGKGYRYKDSNRSADGVKAITFKGGIAEAKMILKAGNNANKDQQHLPTGLTATLSGSASATVQVHGHDLNDCFSVTYDNVKIALPGLFKAKK